MFDRHSHQKLPLLEKQALCNAGAWSGALHSKRSTHWERFTALASMHSASQDYVVVATYSRVLLVMCAMVHTITDPTSYSILATASVDEQ